MNAVKRNTLVKYLQNYNWQTTSHDDLLQKAPLKSCSFTEVVPAVFVPLANTACEQHAASMNAD